jgi:hypothetical protein
MMKEAFESFDLEALSERVTAQSIQLRIQLLATGRFVSVLSDSVLQKKCRTMVTEGIAHRSPSQAAALVDPQVEEPFCGSGRSAFHRQSAGGGEINVCPRT